MERLTQVPRRMVSGLDAEVAREEGLGIGPWISPGAEIYVVGPDQPTVLVQLDDPTASWRAALQAAFAAVPIPPNTQPGSDADAEMTVWQPSSDKLWEFFHMRLLSDGWHAAWGGAIDDVCASPGYYDASAWPGASTSWGATASSLPHAAGVITLADIEQGAINHALAVNLPYPCQGIYSWPAQRTDGTGTAANCIPEGAHLRIDPGLNVPGGQSPALRTDDGRGRSEIRDHRSRPDPLGHRILDPEPHPRGNRPVLQQRNAQLHGTVSGNVAQPATEPLPLERPSGPQDEFARHA